MLSLHSDCQAMGHPASILLPSKSKYWLKDVNLPQSFLLQAATFCNMVDTIMTLQIFFLGRRMSSLPEGYRYHFFFPIQGGKNDKKVFHLKMKCLYPTKFYSNNAHLTYNKAEFQCNYTYKCSPSTSCYLILYKNVYTYLHLVGSGLAIPKLRLPCVCHGTAAAG